MSYLAHRAAFVCSAVKMMRDNQSVGSGSAMDIRVEHSYLSRDSRNSVLTGSAQAHTGAVGTVVERSPRSPAAGSLPVSVDSLKQLDAFSPQNHVEDSRDSVLNPPGFFSPGHPCKGAVRTRSICRLSKTVDSDESGCLNQRYVQVPDSEACLSLMIKISIRNIVRALPDLLFLSVAIWKRCICHEKCAMFTILHLYQTISTWIAQSL